MYIGNCWYEVPAENFMESQLPNISGSLGPQNTDDGGISGCFYIAQYQIGGNGTDASYVIKFDASRSSAIYKNSVTQVYGDSLAINAFIKAKKMNINI